MYVCIYVCMYVCMYVCYLLCTKWWCLCKCKITKYRGCIFDGDILVFKDTLNSL